MADTANYIFLPWVRAGAAATLTDDVKDQLATDQLATVSLEVKFEVNARPLAKTARLYGPGNVTGIDRQQVVRVEPRHGSTDFEPNYFPAVEFDRPDFPWLLTPAKAGEQNRLRPWLCLIVVRKQKGVELRPATNQPLPVLEIIEPAKPGSELPDLAESYLWAHVQVTGATKSDLTSTLNSKPAHTVSRLLCPRRLDPLTDYIACVVPTFEVGCAAGLNRSTEIKTLAPAWLSGDDAPDKIELPVYFSWEFRTSADSDFEELVRRLKPREMPSEAGKRPMNIGDPGFSLDPPTSEANDVTLGLEGALRPVDSKSDAWDPLVSLPFQKALSKILNTPWELATTEVPNPDPVVGPPVYGCWPAGAHRVAPENAESPPWLNELNLDPRNRATAAIGTRVVQEQQEQLMASAWEQLGDVEKINQRLRQAQLSRAVNTKYFTKTFKEFPPNTFLKLVAPAKSDIVLTEDVPGQPGVKMRLGQRLTQSPLPLTAVSASVRKLTRPRSTMNKELSSAGVANVGTLFGLFTPGLALNLPHQTRGAVTVDQVTDALPSMVIPPGALKNPFPPPNLEQAHPTEWPMILTTLRLRSLSSGFLESRAPTPQTSPQVFEAAKAHHDYLTRLFTTIIFADLRRPIQTLELKASVLMSIDPQRTVSRAALDGVKLNRPTLLTGDELEPIMDQPTFPQPMYEALRDLSQDYFFPGMEHVPENTAQVLKTNAKFVESFMVGLNAEMGRELLWRNYPTDQRGTYFQQFWDTATAGAAAQLDIKEIHIWGHSALAANSIGNPDRLVLLIRGDVIRRYPRLVVYAVKAVMKNGKRTLATEHPELNTPAPLVAHAVFRGTLEPDVVFVGFDLTPEEVVEGTGWFFVLQQQPTEPRFGLDDDPFGPEDTGQIPALVTWSDLNWAQAASGAEELKQLSHLPVRSLNLKPTDVSVKGTWGRNSAHMAYITKQLPVRVAIHATELLPAKSGPQEPAEPPE